MASVVVLNASYEHHGKVDFQQAVRMLFRHVAVVEEPEGARMIGPHPWPRVIRLLRYVSNKWMHAPARYSREAVLRRDKHSCAYCGKHATTIDHVIPTSRYQGNSSTFLNTVASCSGCNNRKDNKTPVEAGMRLRIQPWHPTKYELIAGR